MSSARVCCAGQLGSGDSVVHGACDAEWRRRAKAKKCVMCGGGESAPPSFRCANCRVMDNPPYVGYARRDGA